VVEEDEEEPELVLLVPAAVYKTSIPSQRKKIRGNSTM
jgi:hypothetical protein